MAIDLSVKISRLRIANPTILASGVLGTSLPLLERIFESGAGAVVTKSVGVDPREGYPGPNVVEVDSGYLNAIGLSNPGVEAFSEELEEWRRDLPIIVSIFGYGVDEFVNVVDRLDFEVVKSFELNLSCPHVKGVGVEVGGDPKLVSDIVRNVKSVTSKPIFAKLSSNVGDIVSIAKSAEEAGADGITVINTVRAMVIDIDIQMPILSNKVGGLSGRAIKPIAVRAVYEIYENLDIPILGCGGVTSWEDAVEFLLAGASAVQIGTAIAYKGIHIFREVVDGLSGYMMKKGFRRVEELVGAAHNQK